MIQGDSGLHIIPMGGVGDMGMNLMLYRYGDDYLMVDCGVRFPDAGSIGVEHLLPNLKTLRNLKGKLRAIVLTHGHEDHIGSLRWVLKELSVPVYGTPFTLGLVESRLREVNLPENPILREITPGDSLNVGPFDLSFFRVTHSIPDCVSVAVGTPEGVVFQTGDFKIDERPLDGEIFDREGFRSLGDRGVRLLLSDSTNASVPGRNLDEAEVAEHLEPAIAEWDGRVIVTLFSSNLYRISSLHKMAKKHGRALGLVGRSLHRYIQIGREHTSLDLPGPEDLFQLSELNAFDPSRVLILCTGSQAEPMSALFRASKKKHSSFILGEGDRLIFSSREIPGNSFKIGKMINDICRQGVDVVKGHHHKMHASGHAKADELKEVIELLRPKLFVPVHGEYAFLRDHIRLAEEVGVTNSRLIWYPGVHAPQWLHSAALEPYYAAHGWPGAVLCWTDMLDGLAMQPKG